MAELASDEAGVVFVATSPAPAVLVLAAHPSTGVDAGARLKAALSAVGGRGGGSPRLAQGSVPDAADLSRVLDLVQAEP
jgi:alanyl-tRNA synthetase